MERSQNEQINTESIVIDAGKGDKMQVVFTK
jgi:hypothetical protein